jgi:putative FmdB family regulatory protein
LCEVLRMPNYDRLCPSCGWVAVDVLEPIAAPPVACPDCGAETQRVWLSAPPNVIGDEMDHVQVNGLRHPRRFRSKQEHKRWLKAEGFVIKDEHKPLVGTDKSPHSTRWASGGKQWLADAEALAQRNGTAEGIIPEEEHHWHIRWSEGTLSKEEAAKYAR